MKKVLVLFMLVFLLTGCTKVVEVPKIEYVTEYIEIPAEPIIIEKEIITEVEVPVEGFKEVFIEVPIEVVRDLTTKELDEIKDGIREELQKEFDQRLEEEAAKLEPEIVEKEVIKEVPITGETYEKSFDYCEIQSYNEDGTHKKVINVTVVESLFTSTYTLTLKEPDDNGQMQWVFKKQDDGSQQATVCYQTFGGVE